MPVKSICLLTLFCLMELFSVRCESLQLVFPRPQEKVSGTAPAEETGIARVELYPSPLQFAN